MAIAARTTRRRPTRAKKPSEGIYRRTPDAPVLMQPDLEDFEGYLWRAEGGRLAYLASQVPEGQVIVELGSFKGKSACYLARGSKAGAGVPVHCVDVWEAGDQEFARHFARADIFNEPTIFEKFEAQLARARVKSLVTAHKARTVDVAADWTRPVGLLFVDADHHYDACKADTEAWLPHVVPGGWIAWHDYGNRRFRGVTQYVEEFIAEHKPVEITRRGNLIAVRLEATGGIVEPPSEPDEEPTGDELPADDDGDGGADA